jgi:hypothetical protein
MPRTHSLDSRNRLEVFSPSFPQFADIPQVPDIRLPYSPARFYHRNAWANCTSAKGVNPGEKLTNRDTRLLLVFILKFLVRYRI